METKRHYYENGSYCEESRSGKRQSIYYTDSPRNVTCGECINEAIKRFQEKADYYTGIVKQFYLLEKIWGGERDDI